MTETLAGKDILVVEDEQDIMDLVSFNLARRGFKVRGAATGLEALAEVAVKAPDLIVLDVMLPEMDGVEVCRVLRSQAETSLIPIVMLTAKNSVEDILEGLYAGADDYVTKPFHLQVLAEKLLAVLRRTSRNEEHMKGKTT